MTGCIFKRKLKSGISWGYLFFGGWDENGKRIQVFKSGFPAKDAASKAVRVAIEEHETNTGKITRVAGKQGRRTWTYSLGCIQQSGFETRTEAESALREAIRRRDVDEAKQVEDSANSVGPPFSHYFQQWLDEHASRDAHRKHLNATVNSARI